jgi:hypothetical protein
MKCEMVLLQEYKPVETNIINVTNANLIREAYPVFLTESFCKYYCIFVVFLIFWRNCKNKSVILHL